MSDLSEFLLARIAEDEELAREADRVYVHPGANDPMFGARKDDAVASRYWDQIADPGRVLAECEAKRQLVEDAKLAQEAYAALRDSLSGDTERERVELRAYGQAVFVWSGVLLQLALPYADHKDFREEWKP